MLEVMPNKSTISTLWEHIYNFKQIEPSLNINKKRRTKGMHQNIGNALLDRANEMHARRVLISAETVQDKE